MIDICASCGAYRPGKDIDVERSEAVCPDCGHRHPFLRLPLLVVSGASGCGKTTVCRLVTPAVSELAVTVDGDILWGPHFEGDSGSAFFETWLRVAKNLGQSGRPVVLFGAGFGVPENLERCVQRRYFAAIHRLALVCNDDEQERRLRARPSWRGSASDAYLAEHLRFNAWFRESGPKQDPPIELVDSSGEPMETTAGRVVAWVRARTRALRER